MRRLTLVRHAKSSWNDLDLSDFERPLNERGRRDAPVMAQRFKKLRRLPDLLLSSPALRAVTTARMFGEGLGFPVDNIELNTRIYEASVDTLLKLIRGLDPDTRHAMLFGHNPGFSELAHRLATCRFDDMPTCAIASFELQIADWSEAGPGCGRLASYLYPKDGAG